MKIYTVTYRGEFFVDVEAENEEQALYIAERSGSWKFIISEGHKDLFEIKELE